MSEAGSPSFGKTLLARIRHTILLKTVLKNLDTAEIVLFLVLFMFIPCFEF